MSLVGWAIVLGLPVFALVQWWLIVRLGSRLELDEGAGNGMPQVTTYGAAIPDVDDPPAPAASGTVTCRTCGAENDRGYDYCGDCAARLV